MTIQFIGKKSRITRNKLLLIYMRVTIEGKRFEVGTRRHVEPTQIVIFVRKSYREIRFSSRNKYGLDLIKKKVYEYKEG